MTDLPEMTVEKLVSSLKKIWLKQYDAAEADNIKRLNGYVLDARPIYEELKRRGPAAVMQLVALLDDPNIMVRLKAAKMAYCVAPQAARQCLETIEEKNLLPILSMQG